MWHVGASPLHLARRRDVTEVLIEFGADVNARDKHGLTAIYGEPIQNADVIELLLSAGTLIPDLDRLLLQVVEMRYNETLKLLLKMPLARDVNRSKVVMKTSALHLAARRLDVDVTRMLLRAGFNPNIQLEDGMTPAHVVVEQAAPYLKVEVLTILGLLLEANADFELRARLPGMELTPFEIAVTQGKHIIANFLADSGFISTNSVLQHTQIAKLEREIREGCWCKRVFCNDSSGSNLPDFVICDKPLDLSAKIRNPSSLFDLSRRAVRKCLGKRISRVSEMGLPRILQHDVTKAHEINSHSYQNRLVSGSRCECGWVWDQPVFV